MARVLFSSDLQRYTGGAREAEVDACNYRGLVSELCRRFPGLNREALENYSLAIDGVIIAAPLLETFGPDSELIFIAKIMSG